MSDKNIEMAMNIAKKVGEQGGKTYFVGGYVRDLLMGKECKDIDIEVHGITPERLCEILDTFGERMTIGKSFGVYGLHGYDIDIAQPRTEQATGRGHRDFDVFVDPFVGTLSASRRRDFTINALMQDVLTGEIIDHHGGRKDLENKILRHVDNDTFAQDPLRVLRMAQFAARLNFSCAAETIDICKGIDLYFLPKERVMGELEKALLKSENPSIFFYVLDECGGLDCHFKELRELQNVMQDSIHHPEGNAFTHTMLVLDEAAKYIHEAKNPLGFMLAALSHDLGKAISTSIDTNGRIHSIGHETKGLPIVKDFLSHLTGENALIKYVINMTELHMLPNALACQHSGDKAALRLLDRSVCPDDLILLARADRRGKTVYEDDCVIDEYLAEKLSLYKERIKLPAVTGKDLIQIGFEPSENFSKALEYAHNLALCGVDKKSALAQTAAYLKSLNL